MQAIKILAMILWSNLWGLLRWTAGPLLRRPETIRKADRLAIWFQTHEPTNWSARLGTWKATVAKVRDFAKRF